MSNKQILVCGECIYLNIKSQKCNKYKMVLEKDYQEFIKCFPCRNPNIIGEEK